MRSAPYQTSVEAKSIDDEHIGLVAARFQPVLGAHQPHLLLHRREEDEVPLRLHAAAIERAEHLQRRHQVRRVVADTRRSQNVAFPLHFHVGAFREDRVHVRGEHDRRTAAAPLAHAADVEQSSVRMSLSPSFSISARMYFARACSFPEGAGVSTSRIHSSTIPVARSSTDCSALRTSGLSSRAGWNQPVCAKTGDASTNRRPTAGLVMSIVE